MKINEPNTGGRTAPGVRFAGWALTALLSACVLWSYWPTLALMFRSWSRDRVHAEFGPSHGAFVPVFALAVLWARRRLLQDDVEETPALRWLGLALLLATAPVRWFAGYTDYVALDAFSLLPTLAGLILMLGGWRVLRFAWPALVLLTLTLPWPYRIELAVTDPLRHMVAAASAYLLQTAGYPAFLEGAVIRIERLRLVVADECSGLGMLLTFLALAWTIALLSRAPLIKRVVLVASSVVLGVFANVLRVCATAIAFHAWGPGPDTGFVHDLAGWLMMPLAIALLWLELRLLDCLIIQDDSSTPFSMSFLTDVTPPKARLGEKSRSVVPSP